MPDAGTKRRAAGTKQGERANGAARRSRPSVRRAARLTSELGILVREGTGSAARRVEVARLQAEASAGKGARIVRASGRRLEVRASWWEEVHTELKDLVREELAPLDAP